MEQFKIGDTVRGPSMGEDKVRNWKLLAIADDIAIGQNLAARGPFRQPLNLNNVEKI